MTHEQQWDKTVRMYVVHARRFWADKRVPVTLSDVSDGMVGLVVQASRHTTRGDVLIPTSPNGDDRWGFTGLSSKGRHLVGYYQTIRPHKDGGRVLLIKLPDEVANMSLPDPAVRGAVMAIIDSQRAGDVAALQ